MSPGQIQAELTPPGRRAKTEPQNTGNPDKRYLVLGLAALLLVLALVVLFFLPAKVKQPVQPQTPPENTIKADPLPAPTLSGVTQHDAGLALQAFLRLRAQPDLEAAEIWASQTWSEAMATADQGDEHYGRRRFKEAQAAYQAASQQLTGLQADRPQILAEALGSGKALLRNNQAASAISAFELVLAMEPNHQGAQAGLEKAGVREQVLEWMIKGEQAETDDQPSLAAEAYTAALQLDLSYQPAQSALQTINETLARQAYQDAMSKALKHINSGDLNAADKALKRVETLKPGTPELLDAKKRLQSARQQETLNKLRGQARAQAAKENWPDAIRLYKKALSIDTQATFAGSGLQHANTRLKLNAQLDHYLDAPERLSSDEPLKNATALLEANPGVPNNEPLLTAKLAALKEAVRLATIPVMLNIESDNQTQVTIYHIGRLGTFEEKQISLRPGRYTVTGSRAGYRDVRKVILLSPASPASLNIRCEEPI